MSSPKKMEFDRGKVVFEKHELPHGFWLRTIYEPEFGKVTYTLRCSWLLDAVEKNRRLGINTGDEARDFIRGKVAFYREKLGGGE